VTQVASIIKARDPRINGLGPKNLINVRNGMLDWETLSFFRTIRSVYSTYQVNALWDPKSKCPVTDAWMESMFEPEIVKLLWQVMGVTVHPAMRSPKRRLSLLGGGLNGTGTCCRALFTHFLPDSAICAIDPKVLTSNRFASVQVWQDGQCLLATWKDLHLIPLLSLRKLQVKHSLMQRENGHSFTFQVEATMLLKQDACK
jgi:hypothetical protein